ncbi:MAG TPA: polyphosphate kinase 2 family protein [Xanthobacteraceae bacterium]|nr:polyphosphate kinase 2 family protein [Xanthobacteraceae bacterium]
MTLSHFAARFRIDRPEAFRLADHAPSECLDLDKQKAGPILAADIERLSALQERLWAENRWAVLVVLQGMDAAGKDSIIEHVMSGVNPQGCDVYSFKAPSAQELDHDFLWRVAMCLPERGRIGIFNRSHYEEVLAVRVQHELLESQRLPPGLVTKNIWKERFEDICAFERHLARNGTAVLKFFLNISKDEQRRRFLKRLDEPAKRWKFSMDDIAKRERWSEYMSAYEDMVRNTSFPHAPWYVVPADRKWFARLVVASALIDALERLDPQFPTIKGDALAELEQVRKSLQGGKRGRGQ